MELLIVLLLGLSIAVGLSVWLGVSYARTTARDAKHDGTAGVLAQLDTTQPRTVVSWPTAWGRPTVAEVTREAVARGWAVESQTDAGGEHVITFSRAGESHVQDG